MRKEKSGRESDIYNKMQVIVERDTESNVDKGRKIGRCECSLDQFHTTE